MRLGLLLFAAALLQAQDSTAVTVNNGVQLQVTANFGHPTGNETLTVEMVRASGDSFYRIFRDQNHLAVFAYELAVDLSPAGDALTATAKPAEDKFAARFKDADAGKPVPSLSADHRLGPLTSGQSANLPLFNIPGMGLEVSETIRVKIGAGGTAGALHFTGLRVTVEKKPVPGTPPAGSVSGRYAMFYIPGRGAYFFSVDPTMQSKFIVAGSIDGRHMQFQIDNEIFDCTAAAPFLANSGGGNLWVYHDAAYRPDGHWTQDPNSSNTNAFFMAASDSLGWWLQ